MFYPGNADAGMIARQQFYLATRYDGTETNTTNLELFPGNPSTSQGLGDLNRLLEWNYSAVPDSFERNRNQIIYTTYQHNRDPFTDHPEWVWSVFKDQANHSQVSIAGSTVGADGSSTKNVNLGRVFVGGAVPAAQVSTLNKTGDDGTYYSVTTSGAATSSVTGRVNACVITTGNYTVTKTISVGLNTATTSAGVKSGTVTVDNLDITTGGGAGKGANDANDTFNVSLNVLDHVTPSFTSPSLLTSNTLDFGNIAIGKCCSDVELRMYSGILNSLRSAPRPTWISTASRQRELVRRSRRTSVRLPVRCYQIAAGTSQTFLASLNLTNTGTFTAVYTLNFSDENIAGAQNKSVSLTLTGQVRLAGDFNNDGSVDAGDYVVWQRSLGESVAVAYDGARRRWQHDSG